MSTCRTDTRSHLITPESTPVKQRYNHHPSSAISDIADPHQDSTRRRLPRKPARRLPPSYPEPSKLENRSLPNHPIDFMLCIIFQSLYRHLYLNIAVVLGEELHAPILGVCILTTKLAIFVARSAAVLSVGLGLGLCACKTAAEVTLALACKVSTHLIVLMLYFSMLHWSDVAQNCWSALRDHVGLPLFDKEPDATSSDDSAPSQRTESLCLTCPAHPYGKMDASLASPLPLRKRSRHATLGSCPRSMASLPADMAKSPTSTARLYLGHRADDLHRILADCSEAQLEVAGKLVHGLRTRAQARAGWKI